MEAASMNTSTKFIIGIGILIAATSLAAAYPVNSNQLSCTTYGLHDIEMSSITYSDESHNNHDATKYMEPGEKVTLEFHYNLPACDNAVDHSRHVVSFYNSEGEFLGQKTDLQMNQGNWDSSYTIYNVPVRIPEFNTTSVQIETDIYASSVHGSDVWHESNSEEAYDRVIRDTVPEEEGALNLEELPIDSEDINDLKNTRQTSNFWGDCVDLPETINNNSYVTNPNMPGLRISQNNWYMDSGGGHPCYIFSAYEQARALYNWYSVIDTTGIQAPWQPDPGDHQR
ncbi:MAG: hypothetical protein SVU32_01475 [Candidatus Nanohaloarchaea archaeon]|nr:hypothetical protein [Candidatus Nanohaloarchaea archaeon]